MSLMKTLARVAAGVALAKGIGAVMKNQNGGTQRAPKGSSGGILDDLFANNTGRDGGRQTGTGGLTDMLGQVLGGATRGGAGTGSRYGGPRSTGAQAGVGGLLDQLTNAARGAGLGGMLDQLTGGTKPQGGTGTGGGLGDVLAGMLGGGAAAGGLASKGAQPSNDASFGELFNDAVIRQDEPEIAPTPEQNAVAGLMLRAMIQAAKSDGKIDDAERERLTGQLGDIDEDERSFIRDQMAAPVDAQALARDVPKGLEAQVYTMSLMAIDFDSRAEAEYLHGLAQAMGLAKDSINDIHRQLGVQPLYA